MQTMVKVYLNQMKLGRKQSFRNLAVYPLLSNLPSKCAYLLLDEALSQGVVEVAEVSREGAVPQLRVSNHSAAMLLILDGEELVGAKQNRIVNTTILVPGKSTLVIPVSCVEQGRWSYRSPVFSSDKRVLSPSLRAMKSEQVRHSLDLSGEYRSDQGALWEGIAERAFRRGAVSPSMAMGGIYEKEKSSLQEYVRRFTWVDSQVGVVFAINGHVVGLDGLDSSASFSKVFKKLVESYALDAVDGFNPQGKNGMRRSAAGDFLQAAKVATVKVRPSVGLGTDLRLDSESLTGSALVLGGCIFHLCLFSSKSQRRQQDRYSSRMARHSLRRWYQAE